MVSSCHSGAFGLNPAACVFFRSLILFGVRVASRLFLGAGEYLVFIFREFISVIDCFRIIQGVYSATSQMVKWVWKRDGLAGYSRFRS